MPRFKSNNLYQTRPEIKLLLQKKFQSFRALGALPPDPQWPPAAGIRPHWPTQKHSPPIASFWLRTWLVVSTRNTNALHQIFSPIPSTKNYVHERVIVKIRF